MTQTADLPAAGTRQPGHTGAAHGYRAPSVSGELPGPRSRELLDRQSRRESNARTYPRRLPLAIRRAAGSFVEDLDGNVFLDFLSGAGVLRWATARPSRSPRRTASSTNWSTAWTSPPRSRTSSPS